MATDESRTKVTILTETYRIEGYIDLIQGARITDYLVESKEFVALTDAEVYESAGKKSKVLSAPFLNLNRSHIQIVIPQN